MRREPRHPDIIRRPDLQPRGQRTLFQLFTLAAWMVWLYLFLPLISLAAWYLGIEYFASYMLGTDDSEYLYSLGGYLVLIVLAAMVIIGWSQYNKRRFGGMDRRKPLPPVTAQMLSERFHVDRETLRRMQNARRLALELDENGNITQARVLTTQTGASAPV